MSVRRCRGRLSLALVAALAVLLVPGAMAAQAKRVRVTGQQTTLTLSAAAASALQGAGITVAPLAPATAGANGITFPIAGGRVNLATLRGIVFHRGGLSLAKGSAKVNLRRPWVVSTARGAWLSVAVGGRRCHRVARRVVTVRVVRHRHGRRVVRRIVTRRVVRRCAGPARIRALRLTHPRTSVQGASTIVTVDAALTARAARLLDRRFDTTLFKGGLAVGTATATLTVQP